MIVWECFAYGKTGLDAINEFCLLYWRDGRKPKMLKNGNFKVVGGSGRIYTIKLLVDRKPVVYQVTSL